MRQDNDTKQKLLASAKEEFMEKGYQGASLRGICKKAGVTTGALYFFFQDKEDLFTSLVTPVLQKIQGMMLEHMRQELLDAQGAEQETDERNDLRDDAYVSRMILQELYRDYDSVQLLLTRSQGSKMAGCIDMFVEYAQQGYRHLAAVQAQKMGVKAPDDYTVHWMAHMQIDAFVHLLTHEPDEQKAMEHLEDIVRYLIAGWEALFEKHD